MRLALLPRLTSNLFCVSYDLLFPMRLVGHRLILRSDMLFSNSSAVQASLAERIWTYERSGAYWSRCRVFHSGLGSAGEQRIARHVCRIFAAV